MADWISLEEGRKRDGLRLVLLRGLPSPWSQAARGIFELKKIPFLWVTREESDSPEALQDWTHQDSYPAAMYEAERPRTGWAEILLLAERLAPTPALIPADPRDRAVMFGLSHEICGEMGLVWCRRLGMIPPDAGDNPFAQKYGSGPDEAKAARGRVDEILALLGAQLRDQRAAGNRFLVGDALSALDIYWATFCNVVSPLPADQLPLPDGVRKGFAAPQATLDALEPLLLEHRDAIYEEFLTLPVEL